MRLIIAVLIGFLTSLPCLAEKSFDDILNSMVSVGLPNDQEIFFQDNLHATELYLRLKNIDAISPRIDQLHNLQTLFLSGSTTNLRNERYELTIPLEVLNLSNLRILIIDGISDVRLPLGTETSQIQSPIERLQVTGWTKSSIPFLGSLTQLREIRLVSGYGPELPAGLEQLRALRALQIEEHAEPFALEPLCGLAGLERLELVTQVQYPVPDCLTRLPRLKSVSMVTCGREPLPDKTTIYYPAILTSLTSLENLTLWVDGRHLEMPNASYSLKNLRTLTVTNSLERVHGLCPAESLNQPMHDVIIEQSSGNAIYDHLNLDAVLDYPKLEKIMLYTESTLKGSILPIIDSKTKKTVDTQKFERDPIRGIRRFLDIIDMAWRQGKLPRLEQVDMLDHSPEGMGMSNPITVWKRPSSRTKNGTILSNVDVILKNMPRSGVSGK